MSIRYDFFLLLINFYIQYCRGQFGENFEHDGITVYCWHFNQTYEDKLAYPNNLLSSGVGSQCPVVMQLIVPSNVNQYDSIHAEWKVKYDPSGGKNAINLTSLNAYYVAAANDYYQVVHSNIHACKFGSQCSPSYTGQNPITPTTSTPDNFTAFAHTFATDKLSFSDRGNYSVVAHIVIGGPGNTRYDFATYSEVSVNAAKEDSASTSSKGMDTWIIAVVVVASIVGATLIVATIIYCVRRSRSAEARQFSRNQENHGIMMRTPAPDHSSAHWTEVASENTCIPTAITVDGVTTTLGSSSKKSRAIAPSAPLPSTAPSSEHRASFASSDHSEVEV